MIKNIFSSSKLHKKRQNTRIKNIRTLKFHTRIFFKSVFFSLQVEITLLSGMNNMALFIYETIDIKINVCVD